METIALVMAGGRGERMRSSGRPVPKPLLRVRGVPLMERNLYPLLRAGLEEIVVSVPADLPSVGRFASDRFARFARAAGARSELLEETRPLGNIGCAGLLRDRADHVLVVYADNLTTLDLRAVVAHHLATGAGLTLSTHLEPFRMPYGQIEAEDGRVVDYHEKPEHLVLVSSAVSVLGPAALAAAAEHAPLGLSDLFRVLRDRGETVTEYRHAAPWVDVNDAAAAERAERLVATDPAFECWSAPPAVVTTSALVTDDRGVLVRGGGEPSTWTLPLLDDLAGVIVEARSDQPMTEFDDLDESSGLLLRHRVMRADPQASAAPPDGVAWMSMDQLVALADRDALDSPLARALAATGGHEAPRKDPAGPP